MTPLLTSLLNRGASWGGERWGRAPPPAIHTLSKEMSLNKGATHFTLGPRPCIITSLQIYLRPLSKLPSCAPAIEGDILTWNFNELKTFTMGSVLHF